jgi:hypothetical protein
LDILRCQKFVEQTISPTRTCLHHARVADTPFALETDPVRNGYFGLDLCLAGKELFRHMQLANTINRLSSMSWGRRFTWQSTVHRTPSTVHHLPPSPSPSLILINRHYYENMIDVDEELTKSCRRRGRIRIALPHFMLKCVDFAVLSATFARRFSLCASVRAVFWIRVSHSITRQ